MKKVPIVGNLENSFDNSIKKIMGPFGSFYPLLKIATIYSNPTSAIYYTAYKALPYLWDGVTSAKAIELYKSAGLTVGKGALAVTKVAGKGALSVGKVAGKTALAVGIGSAALLGKYSAKGVMGLGRLGKKTFENTVDYFSEKNFSMNNIKEKLSSFKISKDKNLDIGAGGFLNGKNNIKQIKNSMLDKRLISQAAAASYITGISKDEYINNIKQKILNGEMEFDEETGTYYSKGIDKEIKDNNIAKEENNRETIEKEDEPLKIIKIGGDDKVVFRKKDGKITRQYSLGGNEGKEQEITEEEYLNYIKDVEKNREVSKEKNKERDVELV